MRTSQTSFGSKVKKPKSHVVQSDDVDTGLCCRTSMDSPAQGTKNVHDDRTSCVFEGVPRRTQERCVQGLQPFLVGDRRARDEVFGWNVQFRHLLIELHRYAQATVANGEDEKICLMLSTLMLPNSSQVYRAMRL